MIIATYETRNYEFITAGETEAECIARLSAGWDRHAAQSGATMDFYPEEVRFLDTDESPVFLDGQPMRGVRVVLEPRGRSFSLAVDAGCTPEDHELTWSDDGAEMVCDRCDFSRPATVDEQMEFYIAQGEAMAGGGLDEAVAMFGAALDSPVPSSEFWTEARRKAFTAGNEWTRRLLLSKAVEFDIWAAL